MKRKTTNDRQLLQNSSDNTEGMPDKVFSLLNDFVFKCVFGQKKNAQLAICLLNALLKKSGKSKITSLEFLNPFNLKEAAEQKISVVDVKVRDGENKAYIIEVQVCKHEFFIARTVYYLAKLYSGQLMVGEDYSVLQPSTGISILDFDLFKDSSEMHNIFEFRNSGDTLHLPTTMILHYIELPKFGRNKPGHLRTPFEKWLEILKFSEKYITMKRLPDYLSKEEGVAMAVSQLKKVNADREMRQLLEAREKEARHLSLMKHLARKEGWENGRTEGKVEGKAEVALRMLGLGIDLELIKQATGLSETELQTVISNQQPE